MTSTDTFCDGLRRLGYEPTHYDGHQTYITFEFEIPCGIYAGHSLLVGLNVPPDFPTTAPSGPHFTPILINDDGTGQAPRGGLHLNHDASFKALTGEDWQYWSRPFPNWSGSADPVRAYLAHIKNLWSLIK